MCGANHIKDIDPTWFCTTESGKSQFIDTNEKQKEINEIDAKLKRKRHVVVGHNLFTDLVFIYSAFIGKLPDTVEDFQARIHNLFPYVIDTKYLATHQGTY